MKIIGGKGNIASAVVRSNAASKRNEDLLPVIYDIRASGVSSLGQIAHALNERGITAARGGTWGAVQVGRILDHLPNENVQSRLDAGASPQTKLIEALRIAPD
jgi:hypothetical protein